MKRASAIVTNRGGRTCHAATTARELGVPAVVGTRHAAEALSDGLAVTVSCAQGETCVIYEGLLDFSVQETGTKQLPNHGIGLARLELVIHWQIGIHPKALLNLNEQPPDLAADIQERISACDSPRDYYIKRPAEGVATIAVAFTPEPAIVRMSDFKSKEYAKFIGAAMYGTWLPVEIIWALLTAGAVDLKV